MPPEDKVRTGALDRPLDGGFCGRITVTWAAETPLLIGAESGKTRDGQAIYGPLRLGAEGAYVLPGASLRGCIRPAAEIVAGARLTQINAHHRYGLRDFDHPRIRRINEHGEEESLLARNKVKAGWLRRKGATEADGFEIVPCRDWKTIAIADLPCRGQAPNEYQWRWTWLGTEVKERYLQAGLTLRSPTGGEAVDASNAPSDPRKRASLLNRLFVDFSSGPKRSFAPIAAATQPVGELKPTSGGGGEAGTLVFSNRSPARPSAEEIERKERNREPGQPKKREYVFFDDPSATAFDVPKEAWERFVLINTVPGKNRREPDGSWGELHGSLALPDGRLPVFYIGDPADPRDFEFGLTRFFKVAHAFSVGDMRDRVAQHVPKKIDQEEAFETDFVETLFGYVYERDEVFTPDAIRNAEQSDDKRAAPADLARRGRVAFGFARLLNAGGAVESAVQETIMGAPRASYAPFYLAGQFKDYSQADDKQTRLAGRKRYLPRYSRDRLAASGSELPQRLKDQIERLIKSGTQPSAQIKSHLRFLGPRRSGDELRFRGDLRVHNVSAAELGALLWVLTHGGDPAKPCRHMLGRGKPFGFGQMRVVSIGLDLDANDAEAEGLVKEPEAWERPDANGGHEGWAPDGGVSLAPFLRAFHAYMESARPGWPDLPDLREFLAAANPALAEALQTGGDGPDGRLRYPWLQNPDPSLKSASDPAERRKRNEFSYNRRLSNRSTQHVDPPKDPQRYLPAAPSGHAAGLGPDAKVKVPYL